MSTTKLPQMPLPTRRGELDARPVDRWWFVTDEGTFVRCITWTNWEPCHYFGGHPIEYTMRLAPIDPRPLGRRLYCGRRWDQVADAAWIRTIAEHYLTMPIGIWHQHGTADQQEAA